MPRADDDRERVARLLLKGLKSLSEPEQQFTLEYLIGRALGPLANAESEGGLAEGGSATTGSTTAGASKDASAYAGSIQAGSKEAGSTEVPSAEAGPTEAGSTEPARPEPAGPSPARRLSRPAATFVSSGLEARVARLLIEDQAVAQISEAFHMPEDVIRAAFENTAAHSDTPERLSSLLRLLAQGRTRAEAAEELEISEREATAELEQLIPSPAAVRLGLALHSGGAVHAQEHPPFLSHGMASAGSLGRAGQQMVPVRFPEAQHRRLKEWCSTHGFSMAVVVRGLVERFLDQQESQAA
jgi:hypothetical protein